MKFGAHHVYMDDLAGAAGGGGAGASGADAAGAAGGAAGADATQPGAAAGAGAGGDAGSAAAGGTSSALSGGSEWSLNSIPEKFQVKGDDGEIDLSATMRKVDEHRATLEKRMGAGGIRPKTPDEYKPPETEAFKAIGLDDAATAAFRKEAHDMGLSQEQYQGVLSKWATLAPGLMKADQQMTADTAVAALRESWGEQYDTNIKASFTVVSRLAEKTGIAFGEIESAIGNNPTAIRLFAALAPELGEDRTPASAAGATGGATSSHEYMAENYAAYSDPKHPQHKAVTARYQALSARENKGAQPI